MRSATWKRWAPVTGLAMVLALAVACGDDDGQNQNDAAVDAGIDAGMDAGPDAALTRSFTVVVKAAPTTEATDVPLAGATVAVDPPGGARIEQVTDAAGRTTFTDLAWPAGRGAVTAHLDGYGLASVVNLDSTFLDVVFGDGDEAPLYLTSLTAVPPAPAMVTVTGSATGFADPAANDLMLFPLRAYGTFYRGAAADLFTFDIEAEKPFTLIGFEGTDGLLPSNQGYYVDVVTLMSMEEDALSADASMLDLDLEAHEVTPLRVDGTVALPTREDSPLRSAWGMAYVKDWNSNLDLSCGWAEEIERAADGSQYAISWIWTEPAGLVAPITYVLSYDNAYNISYVFRPGYPVAGELDLPLLDVPRWLAPANPAVPYALHEEIQWELFDDVANVQLHISRGEQSVWTVFCGSGATTATVPEPPSSADPATVLGEDALTAVLWTGNPDAANQYWVQLAVSRSVTLNPL